MKISRLTTDAIRTFKKTDRILLGWYSDGYGYSFGNYSTDEGTVLGLDSPADAYPCYCIAEPSIDNSHDLTSNWQKELLSCLLARDYYLFLPEQYNARINPEYARQLAGGGPVYTESSSESATFQVTADLGDAAIPPYSFFSFEKILTRQQYLTQDGDFSSYQFRDAYVYDRKFYGCWWNAATIPLAENDCRLGAYFWLKSFAQLNQKAGEIGIQHRRAMHKATNAGYLSMILAAMGGFAGVMMAVCSDLAKDQDWQWFKTFKQVYAVYNVASGAIDSAGDAAGSLTEGVTDASVTNFESSLPVDVTTNLGVLNMDNIDFYDDSFFTAGGTVGDTSELFTAPLIETVDFDNMTSSFVENSALTDEQLESIINDPYTSTTELKYEQSDAFARGNEYTPSGQDSVLFGDDTYDASVQQGTANAGSSVAGYAGSVATAIKVGTQITGANKPPTRPTGISPITNPRSSVTGGVLSGSGNIRQTVGDFLEGSTKVGQAYQNVRNTLDRQRQIRARSTNGTPRASRQDRPFNTTFTQADGSPNLMMLGVVAVGGFFAFKALK
jgi:hypothetical protein